LVGIFTSPVEVDKIKGPAIILLNTGLNYRVAWHRLNIKIARQLASDGYRVLRFDTHGIGDSEGELPVANVVDLHVAIETGLFTDDCLSAIQFVSGKVKSNNIILFGVCGGALTSIFAANQDQRIKGLIHLAGPVTLSSKTDSTLENPWQAENLFQIYLAKLFNIGAWCRFMGGKADYKSILKTASTLISVNVRKLFSLQRFYKSGNKIQDVLRECPNINQKFIDAFLRFGKSQRKLLFVFPERDTATWEFENFFKKRYLDFPDCKSDFNLYKVISEGNHILSDGNSQLQLISIVKEWLVTNFKEDLGQ